MQLLAPLRVLVLIPSTAGGRVIRETLVRQSDVEVIDAAPCDRLELLLLLRETEPEALVVEQEPDRTQGLCEAVLGEYPHMTILVISPDGRQVNLHWMKTVSLSLSPSAPENIADAIRAVSHM